ncbi:MAG TPA: serine/threonine-protein kinase, partial [Myxococcales bacterium]
VGSGGMSVVYRGLDTALEREVAVKVLHPHLARKEDSRRRLTREAKAVAKLRHPNILEVFDFAAEDSTDAYIVTEYIHGQTLAQYASEHAFDPPEIAALLIHQVAAALGHAHEAGVIHRDLKPENVMIRDDGVVKLTDFGIAKMIDRDDRMTITGSLVGSPAHMAPEIIEGQEAGAESDVFSLGTILYYLITRHLPFTAPNTTAVLKRILDGSYPDPRRWAPALSDELNEIVGTCLARDPAARYPHASKLRDALSQYLSELGLSQVTEQLSAFFLDPPAYRQQLIPKLSEILVERARRWRDSQRPAKALANLNQALALESSHPGALKLLAEINQSHRRQRSRRHRAISAAVAVTAFALLAGCYLGYRYLTRAFDYPPGVGRLTQVEVAGVYYPRESQSVHPEPPALTLSGAEGSKEPALSLPKESRGNPGPEKPSAALAAPDKKVADSERPVTSAPSKPKPTVKFTIQFRPYGYARVDSGPQQPELPQHEFELTLGMHRLRYGCRFCEEQTTTFDTSAPEGLLRLLVQPKPARLRFDFVPGDALVTLGTQKRSAVESEAQPFTVAFPPGVTQQLVSFEVTREGFRPLRDAVKVSPNDTRVVGGDLVPQ